MSIKQQIPNWLTYSRIVVIPLLVGAFYLPEPFRNCVPAALFFYASVTDFFDGYLARAWNASSSLGRFLDPIADKLIVMAALVMLVADGRADVLPTIAILMREILVSGLREFLMELRVPLPVSTLAKYKTAVQMVAIFLLLWGSSAPSWLFASVSGQVLLWVAAILTIVTGYNYCKIGIKHTSGQSSSSAGSGGEE